MRVIVCGGRDFDDAPVVRRHLEALGPPSYILGLAVPDDITIVQGGARGADTLASTLAGRLGMRVETHPAEWAKHGKAAGPIRNRHMLSLGADLVIAFPGGTGTAHMVTLAQTAGVPVLQVA